VLHLGRRGPLSVASPAGEPRFHKARRPRPFRGPVIVARMAGQGKRSDSEGGPQGMRAVAAQNGDVSDPLCTRTPATARCDGNLAGESLLADGGQREVVNDIRGQEGHAIGLSQGVSASQVRLDPDLVETVVGQPGERVVELVWGVDVDG
jgi:hypothetical protein